MLWKTLSGWMQRAGLGDAPRTLVAEFFKIKCGDVLLPARVRRTDGLGQVERFIRLRCITHPEPEHKTLLSRLGLTLPRRLRRIDEVTQM